MRHLTEIELVMALDGEMEPRYAESAMLHMESCAECRNEFEKLGGVSKRVEAYQRGLYPEKPLAADERRSTLIKVPRVFNLPAWGWGLVAAVVLVGLSVAFWNHSHLPDAHPIAPYQRELAGAPTIAPQDDKASASQQIATNLVRPKSGAHVGIHHTKYGHTPKPASVGQQNAANQFTELPFSNATLPLDQATVVRVTLPAAALRQAGVPVNEDNADAMLQADVVLGIDGLPRGIRLVPSGSSGTTN